MSISTDPDNVFDGEAGDVGTDAATAEAEELNAEDIGEGELEADGEMEDEEADPSQRFLYFHAMPAWLVSTLVHILILLILGLVSIADPVKIVNVLTASSSADEGPEIEEISIEQFDPGALEIISGWIKRPRPIIPPRIQVLDVDVGWRARQPRAIKPRIQATC